MKNNQTKFKETELGQIPEDWEVKRISSVAEINAKSISKSYPFNEIEYLDTSSTENGQVMEWQKLILSEAPTRAKRILNNYDIVISTVRPNLKHFAILKKPKENAVASTGYAVVSATKVVPLFLYYKLTTDEVTEYLSKVADTSTSTYPGIRPEVIANLEISLPNMEEQQKIAGVLGVLDDKIELNRKMNKTLESLGQAIFKRWFIIPENKSDWQRVKLGSFFPIKTGKKDANFSSENGKYPFFTCSQGNLKADSYSFDCSALLLAGNGDFSIKWYEGKFEAYQRTYVLEPYDKKLLGFLYFLVDYSLSDITAGHRGSVIHFLTKGMIEDYEIALPSKNDLEKNAEIFISIINNIDSNKKQIETLSQIRDSLLPRLMSGKLRVR